jgi:hypothetical protein
LEQSSSSPSSCGLCAGCKTFRFAAHFRSLREHERKIDRVALVTDSPFAVSCLVRDTATRRRSRIVAQACARIATVGPRAVVVRSGTYATADQPSRSKNAEYYPHAGLLEYRIDTKHAADRLDRLKHERVKPSGRYRTQPHGGARISRHSARLPMRAIVQTHTPPTLNLSLAASTHTSPPPIRLIPLRPKNTLLCKTLL